MVRYLLLSKKNKKVLNNKGMTLVEMLATFALLGLFMVAATRVIAYIMGIYYAAKGNTYGLEVTNMISNKIVGQLEGASNINSFEYDDNGISMTTSGPIVFNKGDIDVIKFVDSTGSVVTFSVPNTTQVLNINYAQTQNYDAETGEGYAETNWYFDPAAYMGYTINKFNFVQLYDGNEANPEYPKNVIKLELEVSSPKYGDFESNYYIKCYDVEEVTFK